MTRENHYQNIEIEIRKQLVIAMQSDNWRAQVTHSSLSDVLCEITIDSALTRIKELIRKLPENYSALPELSMMYGNFLLQKEN